MRQKRVYLSLGSNLGDREYNLRAAILELESRQIHATARSSLYETEPQDLPEQPWFLNMVIECETRCFPLQLLAMLQTIEREMGRARDRQARRGPRPIDIDILLFEQVVMQTEKLTVPHPRMLDRRFVLEPLLEIAPAIRIPGGREPARHYLQKLRGQAIRKL